jgi:hypothetical protein
MAVEDHPSYKQWRETYERMQQTLKQFEGAVRDRRTPEEIEMRRRDLERARAEYDKISAQIN